VLDLPLPAWVLIFSVAAATTSVAGIVLAQTGDAIAEETGLGGLTVGMLLLAAATSLPEVVTDVSAALTGAPDLAVGDLFGSSMANMAILALLEVVFRGRVWHSISRGQLWLGLLAVLITLLAVASLWLAPGLRIGWIGPETVVIVVVYLLAIRAIERSDVASHRAHEPAIVDATDQGPPLVLPERGHLHQPRPYSLRRDLRRFAAATVAIFVSAPMLALSGTEIAHATGIGQTFVGAALVAVSTSLPELVTSLAASRLGAFDLAVGNLLGSNAFNMMILLPTDLAYQPGPLLAAVAPVQVIAGAGALVLMAIALVGLARPRRRRRGASRLAYLMLIGYFVFLGAVGANPA
jgi:cation:H+ antiporter